MTHPLTQIALRYLSLAVIFAIPVLSPTPAWSAGSCPTDCEEFELAYGSCEDQNFEGCVDGEFCPETGNKVLEECLEEMDFGGCAYMFHECCELAAPAVQCDDDNGCGLGKHWIKCEFDEGTS